QSPAPGVVKGSLWYNIGREDRCFPGEQRVMWGLPGRIYPCLLGEIVVSYSSANQLHRATAGASAERRRLRKVRTPQGRALDNVQWGRPQGKCHRKENAECGPLGLFMAKLKRCGKSAPAAEQSAGLVNPARSKTE